MAKITVYSFSQYDPEQGVFFLAQGKCTRDQIASCTEETRIDEASAEEIEDSLLTHSLRYYPTKDLGV